jgi:hypothetical protein
VAGQSSGDLLQQTVDNFAQRVNDYASGIASRLGSPLSGTELSKDEAVQRWNFSPLGSTQAADAQYHQLVAQGMPPGQALDQVYPMRSMLFRGADVNDSIQTAKQIQGWVADASGEKPAETPQGSTLPMLMAMQRPAAPPLAVPPAPIGPGSAVPTPPTAPAIPPASLSPPPPMPAPLPVS